MSKRVRVRSRMESGVFRVDTLSGAGPGRGSLWPKYQDGSVVTRLSDGRKGLGFATHRSDSSWVGAHPPPLKGHCIHSATQILTAVWILHKAVGPLQYLTQMSARCQPPITFNYSSFWLHLRHPLPPRRPNNSRSPCST